MHGHVAVDMATTCAASWRCPEDSGELAGCTRVQERWGHEEDAEDALEHEVDATGTRAELQSAYSACPEHAIGVSTL